MEEEENNGEDEAETEEELGDLLDVLLERARRFRRREGNPRRAEDMEEEEGGGGEGEGEEDMKDCAAKVAMAGLALCRRCGDGFGQECNKLKIIGYNRLVSFLYKMEGEDKKRPKKQRRRR